MKGSNKTLSVERKYELYEESVQNHESDIDFVNEQFKKIRKRKPLSFREDFGGTAAMACDWVKQGKEHTAIAIDLDDEPQDYGKRVHYTKLNDEEKTRMEFINGNVLDDYSTKTDIIVAFNFSYFIFKKRAQLVEYYKKVYEGLNDEGIFFVDIFGGTECSQTIEEETEHDDHTYFWDCDKYNPLNNEVQYYIHFKTHEDGKKHEKVFSYDWRMWSVREIVEIMEEAGFSKVLTYWEEDDEDDDDDGGNGVFYESTEEENCESWVLYIAAIK